jgi:hypothetical protein
MSESRLLKAQCFWAREPGRDYSPKAKPHSPGTTRARSILSHARARCLGAAAAALLSSKHPRRKRGANTIREAFLPLLLASRLSLAEEGPCSAFLDSHAHQYPVCPAESVDRQRVSRLSPWYINALLPLLTGRRFSPRGFIATANIEEPATVKLK